MRAKIFTLIIIFVMANFAGAQTLVKPADFNLKEIASFLETKNYTIDEVGKNHLKITDQEKSSIFIDISEDKKSLIFNIKILLKKEATLSQIETLLRKVNDLDMIKAKYLPEDNSVFFRYNFWIDKGFTKETLLDAIIEFGLYLGDSFALDTGKLFEYQ